MTNKTLEALKLKISRPKWDRKESKAMIDTNRYKFGFNDGIEACIAALGNGDVAEIINKGTKLYDEFLWETYGKRLSKESREAIEPFQDWLYGQLTPPPINAGEPWCHDCGVAYESSHYKHKIIPDDEWKKIAPKDGEGLLCADCIDKRLKPDTPSEEAAHTCQDVYSKGQCATCEETWAHIQPPQAVDIEKIEYDFMTRLFTKEQRWHIANMLAHKWIPIGAGEIVFAAKSQYEPDGWSKSRATMHIKNNLDYHYDKQNIYAELPEYFMTDHTKAGD